LVSKVLRISLCLLLIWLAVMMTGCGSSKETTAPPAGDKAASVSAEELVAKGKAIKGMSFEYQMKIPGGEGDLTVKTWMKGQNIRTEMKNPAGEGNVINIVNADKGVAYFYQPDQKMATKMDISQMKEDSNTPRDPMEDLDPVKMKSLGRETIDGKKCLIYEVAGQDNSSSKVWLWEEYGFPVKFEVVSSGETMVMEYKNIQVGDISDSMFELPAGVQIMSFNMPGQ